MLLLPLTVSWSIDANILVIEARYRLVGVLSLLQAAVSTTIIWSTWLTSHLSVTTVLYAFLLGNVVTFIAGRSWVRGGRLQLSGLGALVKEGAAMAGGQFADVASKRLDQVFALTLLGASGAGIYSVALTAASVSSPIAQSLGNSAFKELSTSGRDGVAQACRHAAALGAVTALGLAAASYFLIPVVFGSAFAAARIPALIAIAATIVSGISYMTSMALIASQRGRHMTLAQTTGLLVGLALMIPGAYAWGPAGAALGMSCATVVSLLISLQRLGIPLPHVLPKSRDYVQAIRVLTRS
jgi:O-antigen/teichoic acid export membrane protein